MLRRHILAFIVVLMVLVITVITVTSLRAVTRDQEHRLLAERANELAAVLGSTTAQTQSALYSVGTAAAVDGATSPLFTSLAVQLTASGGSVVIAQSKGVALTVVATAGKSAPAIGSVLADGRALLAQRALTATRVVTSVVSDSSATHALIALRIAAPTPTVAYLDQVVAPGAQVATTADSPYRDLDVAVYGSSNADPRTLVLSYGGIPKASSHLSQHTFPIGVDTWVVVVAARQSLEGPLAGVLPWAVLGSGIALAILLGIIVEILGRRRVYALRLVDQRTSALREAQASAEHANMAKSEFLSRMSHELRTPLNAVLGFSQLLEMDELTQEQRQFVAQIRSGGQHLLDLINEILDITQIETGKMSFSPEAVLVSDVVNDAGELVRPLADERSIHLLSAEGHACSKYIFADRQRIKQILLNLLGNGIKYNRQGGSVSISCFEAKKGLLRIQVTDTGPGIPADQFELLFAPFERLGAEQTSVEGTGIGLALSRRLAEAMGGTLDFESTVGRGSTFWVEFAMVEGPVERYERAILGSGTAEDERSTGPTILHIEDNLSNVELVERVLAQRPSVTLIPTMQGRLGLELARQHQPILILLDLNLADLPGDQVLRLLREDPRTANIPVVIVSADAMPRQIQRLLSGGAAAYLTKPIDVRELLRLVDDALATGQATVATPLPMPRLRDLRPSPTVAPGGNGHG